MHFSAFLVILPLAVVAAAPPKCVIIPGGQFIPRHDVTSLVLRLDNLDETEEPFSVPANSGEKRWFINHNKILSAAITLNHKASSGDPVQVSGVAVAQAVREMRKECCTHVTVTDIMKDEYEKYEQNLCLGSTTTIPANETNGGVAIEVGLVPHFPPYEPLPWNIPKSEKREP